MSAIVAVLIACSCPCEPRQPIDWSAVDAALVEAARETSRKLRDELDAITRKNRVGFEFLHPRPPVPQMERK